MKLSELTNNQWKEIRADLIEKLPDRAGLPKRWTNPSCNHVIRFECGALPMDYDTYSHRLSVWSRSSRGSGRSITVDELVLYERIILEWCKLWRVNMEDLI